MAKFLVGCSLAAVASAGCFDELANIVEDSGAVGTAVKGLATGCHGDDRSQCQAAVDSLIDGLDKMQKDIAPAAKDCGSHGPDCTTAIDGLGDAIGAIKAPAHKMADECAGKDKAVMECLADGLRVAGDSATVLKDVHSVYTICKAGRPGPEPTGKTLINDPDLIDAYNSVNGATWVAGVNDFFMGMTFDDARPLLGTTLSHIAEHVNDTLPSAHYAILSDPPSEFDARKQWPHFIHPIRNQERCGSCWAFSASEAFSDRVAIASSKPSPVLSPEDMVSCDMSDDGCSGGMLDRAWNYLKVKGIVTDACFPYTAGGGIAPECVSACADGAAFDRQQASSIFAIHGVVNMQKELAANGPVQVAFNVYKSFMSYKSGVYVKHFWELFPEGGHAVKAVGWGVEDGTDYWLIANSWDTTWGLDGFFKIKRGSDQCGIETRGPPYAGMPKISTSIVV